LSGLARQNIDKGFTMMDVYAFATPNSIKVPVALEELDLDYVLHAVNVRKANRSQPNLSR
jgi:hypothetical protein